MERITKKQRKVVSPQKQLKEFAKTLGQMHTSLGAMMKLAPYCGPDETLIAHLNKAKLAVSKTVKHLEKQ